MSSVITVLASSPEVDIHELTTLVGDYRLCRSIYLVSLVLLVYDWFLAFRDEVTFMWKRKFVWTTTLYMISRYWTLANMIISNVVLAWPNASPRLCHVWYYWYIGAGIPSLLVAGLILLLRIHAIYDCDKQLLIGMSIFSAARIVTELVLIFGTARGMYCQIFVQPSRSTLADCFQTAARLPPGFTGCLGVSEVPYRYAYWIPTIVFESLLFSMAIFKSIRIGLKHTPHLMLVLIRDSITFYGGMLAVVLTNCLLWALGRPTLFSAFPSTFSTIGSVLACRMILNAREAVNPWSRYDSGLFGMSDIMSTLRFMTSTNQSTEEHVEISLEGVLPSKEDSVRSLDYTV